MGYEYKIFQSKVAKLDLEYLYTVERNITFIVKVLSGAFSGEHPFCLHKNDISDVILILNHMSKEMKGECIISDGDSYSFIKIEFEERDVTISGQLGWASDDDFMKFKFTADQTLVVLLESALIDMKNI